MVSLRYGVSEGTEFSKGTDFYEVRSSNEVRSSKEVRTFQGTEFYKGTDLSNKCGVFITESRDGEGIITGKDMDLGMIPKWPRKIYNVPRGK